jgi:apolipoprotein N-acyltransferase
MTTHNGNSKVKSGYYFSINTLGVEVVSEDGGTLPGPVTRRYISVPFPLLFVVVPVVGLAFLMFLPLIGFALLAYAVIQRVTGHVSKGANALAATVAPPQATGAAYLGGREGEKKNEQVSPEIEKLEKEIADKRKS